MSKVSSVSVVDEPSRQKVIDHYSDNYKIKIPFEGEDMTPAEVLEFHAKKANRQMDMSAMYQIKDYVLLLEFLLDKRHKELKQLRSTNNEEHF